MSASTTAIAAIAAQRRRVVRHFQSVGAISAQTAIPPGSLPLTGISVVSKLQRAGVLHTTPDGWLYLDRQRWDELSEARQHRVKIALLVVVVVIAAILVGNMPGLSR